MWLKRLLALLCAAAVGLLAGCAPALAQAKSEPLCIAVIDTGFSTAALPTARVAEGQNYVFPQEDTEDLLGHGTAVAGILAENCSAQLLPLVYYSRNADKTAAKVDVETVAQIIRDAVDKYGCGLILLSSGTPTDSDALRQAADYAESKNVLVVSCAGNEGADGPTLYPGAYDTVLCVGALNKAQTGAASYSQPGAWVDLLAPGTELSVLGRSGGQLPATGTSYAAAYACAAAANLLEADPTLTPAQLRALLLEHAKSLDAGTPPALDGDAALAALAVTK